jgi:DNA repair protein RadC
MKYCVRTINWKFSDASDSIPELTSKKRVFIREPQHLVENYSSLFKDQVRERFIVFWLNAVSQVLGFEIITEGILNSSLAHPREVFRGAIVSTATSIIIAHNHPSENAEPSQEDISITKQLVEAGKIIGIPVHDHIIFAGESFNSLAELRMI